MCFTAQDADLVVEKMDLILTGTGSAPFDWCLREASLSSSRGDGSARLTLISFADSPRHKWSLSVAELEDVLGLKTVNVEKDGSKRKVSGSAQPARLALTQKSLSAILVLSLFFFSKLTAGENGENGHQHHDQASEPKRIRT